MRIEYFDKFIKRKTLKSLTFIQKRKLECKRSLVIAICSLLVLCSVIVSFSIKFDLVNLLTAKRMAKKVSPISEIKVPGDSTVSFRVNGNIVNLSLEDSKCEYYTSVDGKIVKKDFQDFLSKALFNNVKATPNSEGNFLYYIVDNYTGLPESKEYKQSDVSCRYSKVPEGYLLEVSNTNYKKGKGLIYFNEKGELNEERVYDRYFDTNVEFFQLLLTDDYDCESLVKTLVDYLSNL